MAALSGKLNGKQRKRSCRRFNGSMALSNGENNWLRSNVGVMANSA
jgi:hypothetical protein